MTQFERWNLLLVGEALKHQTSRADEFQHTLDLDSEVVQQRLDDLVRAQLMGVVVDPTTGESDYVLTDKGRGLDQVIEALDQWGSRWALPALVPVELTVDPGTAGVTDHRSAGVPAAIGMSLLGSFRLRVADDEIFGLAIGSQRLLVLLALQDRAVTRVALAGILWPDATEERAGISLRSALSRVNAATRDAIVVSNVGLRLASSVAVDLRDGQSLAQRLLRRTPSRRLADLSAAAVRTLSQELLPDWYDEWVMVDAEDWRQLRVSALEAIARELVERDRYPEAAIAARAAMKVDPLRESAHASLIRVHLAEGNQSDALRVFDRYADLLSSSLGLEPTEQLQALVAGLSNARDKDVPDSLSA
jgi:DNA-binding SARP family transcriptional activator/DNA-binding HxlR family transcriptional regulator